MTSPGRKPTLLISSFALFAVLAVRDVAHAECECSEVLITERSAFSRDRQLELALLQSLDVKGFEALKRDLATGAKLPIEGIPVQGHMNYGDFQEAVRQRSETLSFNLKTRESLSLVTSKLSEATLEKWLECQALCQQGFSIAVTNVSNSLISIKALWRGFPGVGADLILEEVRVNGALVIVPGSTTIGIHGPRSYTFARGDKKTDQIFVFSGKTSSGISVGDRELVVAAEQTPPPAPKYTSVCRFPVTNDTGYNGKAHTNGLEGVPSSSWHCSGLKPGESARLKIEGTWTTESKPADLFLCIRSATSTYTKNTNAPGDDNRKDVTCRSLKIEGGSHSSTVETNDVTVPQNGKVEAWLHVTHSNGNTGGVVKQIFLRAGTQVIIETN